jgi:HlyD family secretion protein
LRPRWPGRLIRVEFHDGDEVKSGDVVARLEPAPLDPRARAEARARLEAARSREGEARDLARRAEAELAQAQRERQRSERLATDRFVSEEALERARTAETTTRAALDAARAGASAARSEVRVAEAALLAFADGAERPGRLMLLRSPVDGRVLRIHEKSERTVAAGTPLMAIGDPARFEIVADVLSTDAVRIRPGSAARLEEWGGEGSLRAKVRLVEPYAFTKVSALGIEEQRVNVVLDPVDSLGPLGDGYRVEARIVVWSGEKVLKAPSSALFRSGAGWAAFRVDRGRVRKVKVEIGERNPSEAQMLHGLAEGDTVVRYPTNELTDGARVRQR